MLKVAPTFFKNTLEKFSQRCRHHFYENSHYTVRDYAQARSQYDKFQSNLLDKIVGEIIANFENDAEGHCYTLEQYLATEEHAEHSWIIELFDGETNFLRQVPCFAIGLTYVYQGKAQETAYLDPIHDELYHACLGKGAQMNARRLQIEFCPQAFLKTGTHQIEAVYQDSLRQFGAANLSLCWLAAGRLDMIIHRHRDKIQVSPGAKLLLKESKALCLEYVDPRNQEKYTLFGHREVLKNTIDQWNLLLSSAKAQ